MLAAVVAQCSSHLGPLVEMDASRIASRAAILCDFTFFALSSYFGIHPTQDEPKQVLYAYSFDHHSSACGLLNCSLSLFDCLSGASLHGYIAYFSDVLTPWWFIPTLIPFLLIATFLYWLFEKLSDRQAKTVATVACFLTAWGFISYVLTWTLRSSGHETLVLAVGILQRFVPAVMIPGSGYFTYFCLGYFFRRFTPGTSAATRKKLIVIGLCAWAVDVACAYLGIDRFDPSFH